MEYSVLTEPVIPVQWKDGHSTSLGIRDVFLNAHQIKDVQGDSPLERYALLRFLIAFSMDMIHPKNSYARRDLLDLGHFDADTFDSYTSLCQKDGPCFDLTNQERPFLQSRYDSKLDAKAEKPVATIIHSLPSGNNHTFIDHRTSREHSVSLEKAFRALLTSYLFCVSGTAGPSSVNNTPPLYTVIIGNSLYETIILNMLSEAEAQPLPYGIGMVPWRKRFGVTPKEKVASISLLEGLTWMPRRILLVPSDDGSVQTVFCQAGLDFRGNDMWQDPHVPMFRKDDGTFGTVKPEPGRALWRDVGTLLYDHDSSAVRQPQVLRCITNILDQDELPDWIQIRAAGLMTKQAAYTGWYEDELSLPSDFIRMQELADIFRADLAMTESMQTQIFKAVQTCVDKPREKADSNEYEIATQCQQYFLNGAHDWSFGPAMQELLSDVSEKEHAENACSAIKDLIRNMLSQVLRATGNDTRSVMRQMKAEAWIWSTYKKLSDERMKYYA